MKLSDSDEAKYERLFILKHGISPIHASLKFSQWCISVWNDEDISGIIANPRHVATELAALWHEIENTDRNTTVKPILSEINSSVMREPIMYDSEIPNILTNVGMTNMAQLATGDSLKTNDYCNVGDDGIAATLSDTSLANQIDSKNLEAEGNRETIDQQERYSMTFFGSDYGGTAILREAGITADTDPSTGVIQVVRVTFEEKELNSGQSLTVQITVTHKNGTQ